MMEKEDWSVIREALLAAGCDKNKLKQWQKKYEKLLKQLPDMRKQYHNARTMTTRVEELAKGMEKWLVQETMVDRNGQKDIAEALKEMKRLQGSFDNEFLISREDREFHSTYDSILKLGLKALEQEDQRLLLQSEIENLLSMLRENLEKIRPDLTQLAFFYQGHTDEELVNLPPAERLEKVAQVYREELYTPIEELVLAAIPLADSRMEELLKRGDRKSRSEAEQLGILWNRPGEQRPASVRAEWILGELLN